MPNRSVKASPAPETLRRALNFAGFYAGWFGCAWSAAWGWPALAPAAVGCVAALHLALAPGRAREAALMAAVGAFGVAADQALIALGVFALDPARMPGLAAPLWSFCFWANFAATLNASLAWLAPRPRLAALFGAVGGPLAYAGGRAMGAITFPASPFWSLVASAIFWAAAAPALFWAARPRG